jgi:hypothetical protein
MQGSSKTQQRKLVLPTQDAEQQLTLMRLTDSTTCSCRAKQGWETSMVSTCALEAVANSRKEKLSTFSLCSAGCSDST